jgi:hypothetical protein
MIESILDRASANQYGYAVRDVRNYESLAGQLPEDVGIEGHDAFMAPCARSTAANPSSGNSFVKAPEPEASAPRPCPQSLHLGHRETALSAW